MIRIPKLLACAAVALAFSAAPQAEAAAQSSAAHWRGGRSEQAIDQAVRHYGFRPNRLTRQQIDAIQRAWTELLGRDSRTRPLNRTQATAIVYMALVHPYEQDGWYDEGRPGGGRRGGGWSDRPGDGRDDGGPPYRGGEACVQMEADAYRLENVINDAGSGLFITEPDRGRARTLARQIQQHAVECRASAVADRAGDILRVLSATLPSRSDLEPRVDALKQAIRQSTPGRRRDGY
jgi:hypothetical protein